MLNKTSLDRWITGNFGEDEFEDYCPDTVEFGEGVKARRNNRPATDNPYNDEPSRRYWLSGWMDEDMVLHEWEVE